MVHVKAAECGFGQHIARDYIRSSKTGIFPIYLNTVTPSNISKIDTASRKDGQRKTKVLIVDDEQAIREVLELFLQEWGYVVRLASDGVEATVLVESYDIEIVFY